MTEPKIYLAGSIEGLPYEEANGWRKQVEGEFPDRCLNPLRDKEWLPQEEVINSGNLNFEEMKNLVERDIRDIGEVGLLLAKMESPGIGTSMEIIVAKVMKIPVILISGNPAIYNHPWIRFYANRRVRTVEEAIEIIKEMDNDNR